jgi:hypothetical protein
MRKEKRKIEKLMKLPKKALAELVREYEGVIKELLRKPLSSAPLLLSFLI